MTPLAFIAGIVPAPGGDKDVADEIVGISGEFGALMSVANPELLPSSSAPAKDAEATLSAFSFGAPPEKKADSHSLPGQSFPSFERYPEGSGLDLDSQSQPTLNVQRAAGPDAWNVAGPDFTGARIPGPPYSDLAHPEQSPQQGVLAGGLPIRGNPGSRESLPSQGLPPDLPETRLQRAGPAAALNPPIADGAGPTSADTRPQTAKPANGLTNVPAWGPPPQTIPERGEIGLPAPSKETPDAIRPDPVTATRAGTDGKPLLNAPSANSPEKVIGGKEFDQSAGSGPLEGKPEKRAPGQASGLRASDAREQAVPATPREQIGQPVRRDVQPASSETAVTLTQSVGTPEYRAQGYEPSNAAPSELPALTSRQEPLQIQAPPQRKANPEQAGARQVPLPMETSLVANLEPQVAKGSSAGPNVFVRTPQPLVETSVQTGFVASAQAEHFPEPSRRTDLSDVTSRFGADRSAPAAFNGTAALVQAASASPVSQPNQLAIAEPLGLSRAALGDPKALGETAVLEIGAIQDSRPATSAALTPSQIAHEVLPHVIQQLSAAAQQMKDGPVEIHLSPEELGRVRLSMNGSDAAMAVVIQVERPETMDLFRRHIDVLAQQFRDLGYSSLSFSFEQQTQDGANAAAKSRTENEEGTAPTSAEPSQAAMIATPTEALSSLDLRL